MRATETAIPLEKGDARTPDGPLKAMENYINFSQIVISVLLMVSILLQVRGQGSGAFGAAESTFRTRRGLERTLFQSTIILGVTLVIVSIVGFQLS